MRPKRKSPPPRPVIALLMAVLCMSVACAGERRRQPGSEPPHLRAQGEATQLIVDGRPFLMLAGEIGNSTASDLGHLRECWPRLEALHLNTVLAPVYWDRIEPEEGRFDFTLVDGLVAGARAHGMRLVLLWFGSWKNSMSSYAPAWVKRDQRRFPRSQTSEGRTLEILSPFHEANRDADARAFAALMRRLREIDATQHTVLMVQVENEIGMIPEARDHGEVADRYIAGAVPAALLASLSARRASLVPALRARWESLGARTDGTWEEVFGRALATDEIFMAWHFAIYTEAVGFSPFAIEDLAEDDPLGEAYDVLQGLAPVILEHQGRGTVAGVRAAVAFDGTVDESPQEVRLGDFTLRVGFVDPFTPRERQAIAAHGGLVVQLGPEEYLVAGRGLTVTFSADDGIVGIESVREGVYENGEWTPGRWLNGDQTHQGRHLRLPPGEYGVQRVRLYRYS